MFDEVGLFDESFHHGADFEWFLRARARGFEKSLLEDVLVYRRLHGTNLSIKGAEASRREHLSIIQASLRRRRANPTTMREK